MATILQAFFGEAQTGLGYQFYDKDGVLLGTRVTTGIDSLPEAGGYAIEVTVPEDAAGIFWNSDSSEASESLATTVVDSGEVIAGQPTIGQSGFLSAGFGTLDQLKARLLPAIMESYDAEGEWDADLKQIGLATAGAFNMYCNRNFEREVGASYSQSGGMSTISLDRYPVEALSALTVQTSSGVEDYLDSVYLLKADSGLVEMDGFVGCYRDLVTATFTGGYWLGTRETVFQTVTAAVPVGVTEVSVTVPDGYDPGHAVAASVERLAGDGQLVVANYDTTGAAVVVIFTAAAVVAEAFEVSVRFEIPPSESVPVGAQALPHEIFEAWVMQSQAAMQHLNTLRGAGVQSTGDKTGSLDELALLPAVTRVLDSYKRFR